MNINLNEILHATNPEEYPNLGESFEVSFEPPDLKRYLSNLNLKTLLTWYRTYPQIEVIEQSLTARLRNKLAISGLKQEQLYSIVETLSIHNLEKISKTLSESINDKLIDLLAFRCENESNYQPIHFIYQELNRDHYKQKLIRRLPKTEIGRYLTETRPRLRNEALKQVGSKTKPLPDYNARLKKELEKIHLDKFNVVRAFGTYAGFDFDRTHLYSVDILKQPSKYDDYFSISIYFTLNSETRKRKQWLLQTSAKPGINEYCFTCNPKTVNVGGIDQLRNHTTMYKFLKSDYQKFIEFYQAAVIPQIERFLRE